MAMQTRRQRGQQRQPTSSATARTAVGRGLPGRGAAHAAAAAEGQESHVEAGRRGLPVLLRCPQNQGRVPISEVCERNVRNRRWPKSIMNLQSFDNSLTVTVTQ